MDCTLNVLCKVDLLVLSKEFCEGGLLGLSWAAMACGGTFKGEAVGGEG